MLSAMSASAENLGILHSNPKVVYTFFEAIPENGPFVEESVNWKIKDAKISTRSYISQGSCLILGPYSITLHFKRVIRSIVN